MINYINLTENTSDVSWRLRLSMLGKLSLDEVLDNAIIYEDYDSEELQRQREILDKVEYIVKKYLTNKEQLIYHCIINMNKRVADVMRIVGFDDWRTTSNNIERVFKMIKLYYGYENLDKKELARIIKENFTPFEQKIIKLLEKRYTIHQIKDKLGFHYAKAYMTIKDILDRLKNLPEPCQSYYQFLINIRKFKKLSDFKIKDNVYIVD